MHRYRFALVHLPGLGYLEGKHAEENAANSQNESDLSALQVIVARSSEHILYRRLAFRVIVLTIVLQRDPEVADQAVAEVEIDVTIVRSMQAQRFSSGQWWSVRLLRSVFR